MHTSHFFLRNDLSSNCFRSTPPMAEMNGTQLSVREVNLTEQSSPSSSWQDDAVRGVQIAATLLIFLVRDPSFMTNLYTVTAY